MTRIITVSTILLGLALPGVFGQSLERVTRVGDQPTAIIAPRSSMWVYVANSGGNTITVLDRYGRTVAGLELTVGYGPSQLIDRIYDLYCLSKLDNSVSFIDVRTNTVNATVRLNATPRVFRLGPPGRIYVACHNTARCNTTLYAIDPGERRVVGTMAFPGEVQDLSGTASHVMLLSDAVGNCIWLADVVRESILGAIPTGPGAGFVHYLDDHRSYCLNRWDGTATLFSVRGESATATFPVGVEPIASLYVWEANNRIFVANYGGRSVSTLVRGGTQVIETIPTGEGPCAMLTDMNAGKLYIANNQSNDVTVYDIYQARVVTTIPVPAGPRALAQDRGPDGYNRVFVACERSGQVAVIVDSAPVGVSERRLPLPARSGLTTIIRGSLFLPRMTNDQLPMTMIDATGRKVMELQSGENDVRHLAPGVYFIRASSWERSPDRDFVRKVVIQR